jgi:Arc/MetJ family transcription regulator
MHTVRMTLNVDEELLAQVIEAHPGVTKTELVQRGLRALLTRQAEERLAKAGGTARRARRPKRTAWSKP